MKVTFRQSMVEQVNTAIERYGASEIKEIQLTRDEYIAFLEELCPQSRVLMSLPGRIYSDVPIVIVP